MILNPQDPRIQHISPDPNTDLTGQSIKLDPGVSISIDKNFLKRPECLDILSQHLTTNVSQIGLSERVANILTGKGINTLGELLNSNDKQLLNMSGFGELSLQEVYQRLRHLVTEKLEASS